MKKNPNGQIKILTTVNLCGVIINNDEICYLKETGNNTYVKQQEKEVLYLQSENCEKFEEMFDFSIKNGLKKILMVKKL